MVIGKAAERDHRFPPPGQGGRASPPSRSFVPLRCGRFTWTSTPGRPGPQIRRKAAAIEIARQISLPRQHDYQRSAGRRDTIHARRTHRDARVLIQITLTHLQCSQPVLPLARPGPTNGATRSYRWPGPGPTAGTTRSIPPRARGGRPMGSGPVRSSVSGHRKLPAGGHQPGRLVDYAG